MGDLTNKQISQTYDALIQTGTDNPIDGTLRPLQDGLGNELPIEVSTTGVNFTGTVTGIPASTDTTYDLGAAGAAGNINIALSGSDASNDVVTMQAGTNITLTDNGSNTFTIDAAGGGGGATTTYVFSPGVASWAGPAGQDVLVSNVVIPANTILPGKAATIEFRSPVLEGSEGQWIYVSAGISSTPQNFEQIAWLGRQTISGGGDPHMWYRSILVDTNGHAYYKDHNDYTWPGGGGDPVAQVTNMDWTIDNNFWINVWADAENATWTAYAPSLTITIQS